MSTIVSASVTFGLVHVPVNVSSVSSPKAELSFKTLHAKCGTPIKQEKVCPVCSKEEWEGDKSLVKGFEVAKKTFVQLTEEELAPFVSSKSQEIKLTKFIPSGELNPLLISKSYYLAPNETMYGPYALLSATMEDTHVSGIGKSSLWGKECPVAIESEGSILRMHILHCAEDMVSTVPIQAQTLKFQVKEEEKALASAIVSQLLGTLEEADLTSVSRERTLAYIEAKANSQPLPVVEKVEESVPTVDIMEALRATMAEMATA